jgi:hypothetical protein
MNKSMQVDDPSLTCPKSVFVRANEEAALAVRFEPCSIGTMKATIKAASSTTGDFM